MSKKTDKKIRNRASTVVLHEGKLLTIKAVDPTSGKEYLFVPGGKVEISETAAICAVRETFEETGYEVCLTAQTPIEIEYDFPWDGQINHCHTVFFAAHLTHPQAPPANVQDAAYIKGYLWIPIEQIDQHFAYSKAILQSIQKLVKN